MGLKKCAEFYTYIYTAYVYKALKAQDLLCLFLFLFFLIFETKNVVYKRNESMSGSHIIQVEVSDSVQRESYGCD